MIICVCKRVSHRDIEAAVAAGIGANGNFQAVCQWTGAATCCGKCELAAQEVFDRAQQAIAAQDCPSIQPC